MTWIITLSIWFFTHPDHEEKIVFKSGLTEMTGFLYRPASQKKCPVVIIAHAAGLPLHDAPIYKELIKNLTGLGVTVFSYDRRGNGLSGGDSKSSDLKILAGDLGAAIRAIKISKEIDSSRIGLYGISQGSWVAPIAYSEDKSSIRFMILVSASGVSPSEQMKYSASTSLKMDGYSDSIIRKGIEIRNLMDNYYRGKLEKKTIQDEIDLAKDKPWFGDLYLPDKGVLPDTPATSKWFHDMDFQPVDYFKQINIPLLLIYGATDRWVPIGKSIGVWREIQTSMRNQQFSIKQADRAGHMMIENEETKNEKGIISPEYSKIIKDWTQSYLKNIIPAK